MDHRRSRRLRMVQWRSSSCRTRTTRRCNGRKTPRSRCYLVALPITDRCTGVSRLCFVSQTVTGQASLPWISTHCWRHMNARGLEQGRFRRGITSFGIVFLNFVVLLFLVKLNLLQQSYSHVNGIYRKQTIYITVRTPESTSRHRLHPSHRRQPGRGSWPIREQHSCRPHADRRYP